MSSLAARCLVPRVQAVFGLSKDTVEELVRFGTRAYVIFSDRRCSYLAVGVPHDTAVVGHVALDVLHGSPKVAYSATLRHAQCELVTLA